MDNTAALPVATPLTAPTTPAALPAAPILQPHSGYDVICLAVIEWQFRFQRPQQIATQFAEHGHRVFYINPVRLLSANSGCSYNSLPLAANLWDVRLAASTRPMMYRDVLPAASVREMAAGLDALRREQGIHDAVCIVEFPSWTPLAFELKQRFGWKIVYDCMDEWQNFDGVQKPALQMEEELARCSDLLMVSGRRLLQKWQSYNEHTLLLRNGVSPEFFARGCKPNDVLKDMPHPIIGYSGAIAAWFDVQLVHDIAAAPAAVELRAAGRRIQCRRQRPTGSAQCTPAGQPVAGSHSAIPLPLRRLHYAVCHQQHYSDHRSGQIL